MSSLLSSVPKCKTANGGCTGRIGPERSHPLSALFPEDPEEFFKSFLNLFEEFDKLCVPLSFVPKKSEKDKPDKPRLLIFGEMGNGKSTTGNQFIKNQLRKKGIKF